MTLLLYLKQTWTNKCTLVWQETSIQEFCVSSRAVVEFSWGYRRCFFSCSRTWCPLDAGRGKTGWWYCQEKTATTTATKDLTAQNQFSVLQRPSYTLVFFLITEQILCRLNKSKLHNIAHLLYDCSRRNGSQHLRRLYGVTHCTFLVHCSCNNIDTVIWSSVFQPHKFMHCVRIPDN